MFASVCECLTDMQAGESAAPVSVSLVLFSWLVWAEVGRGAIRRCAGPQPITPQPLGL